MLEEEEKQKREDLNKHADTIHRLRIKMQEKRHLMQSLFRSLFFNLSTQPTIKGEKQMKIEIENIRPSNHATIKGNFDVLFPDLKLKIKECRLVKKKSGEEYFIGFPSYKDSAGSWIHQIFMEDKENPIYKELVDIAVHATLEAQRTGA